MLPEFESFSKIFRLAREIVITEKIDGTNAQVLITEAGDVFAGSRTRWVTPQDDNAGFACWVDGNKSELLKLGPGRHYGEWWGSGIGRGYGLKEKRFSLFNTGRWYCKKVSPGEDLTGRVAVPDCCSVVPVLFKGEFCTVAVEAFVRTLKQVGSFASPGFTRPEGLIVFHTAANMYFKKTLEDDEKPKSLVTQQT